MLARDVMTCGAPAGAPGSARVSGAQQVAQGWFQRGVAELEAVRKECGGDGAAAVEQVLGQLADHGLHGERGHGQPRGAVQGLADRGAGS